MTFAERFALRREDRDHEYTETPSATQKRLGKRRLRNIQPPESRHMEHERLPAVCPKASFVAAFSAPRMRASVSSVVLYPGMLNLLRSAWLSRRRLSALRVRLRRIYPPLRFGAFPLRRMPCASHVPFTVGRLRFRLLELEDGSSRPPLGMKSVANANPP